MASKGRTGLGHRAQNVLFMLRLFLRKPALAARTLGGFMLAALGRTRLRFMDVAVDYTCNMTCAHCSAKFMTATDRDRLSLEELAGYAEMACREGCLLFHFTGGEPLLRSDLEDIIQAFKPRRCLISIQTNGLLLTRRRVRSLKAAGADIICVSIDSGIPEEHDRFRGMPGAFHRAIEAAKLAREEGMRTLISTCISHTSLYSEGLRRVIALSEDLGLWCIFNLAVPVGRWQDNQDVVLTPEDRREMERLLAEHPNCRTDFHSNYFHWGCGAVKEKLYLTSYGDVMPCPFIQVSLGNIRDESLPAIRSRALRLKDFQAYPEVCLAAESQSFHAKTPCYHGQIQQLPIPYQEVDWIRQELIG